MTSVAKICSIEDCNKEHQAHGWCTVHYGRWRRYGDPNNIGVRQMHGLHGNHLYMTWANIRQRTLNKTNKYYSYYGGRGIKMCNGWEKSFKDFHADIGDIPSKSYSLDRINNDGGYTCGKCEECQTNNWPINVRWATRVQQSRNRRKQNSKSGYTGVSQQKNIYVARIWKSPKLIHIGCYGTPEEAALAFNKKSIELYGDDAKLNVIN